MNEHNNKGVAERLPLGHKDYEKGSAKCEEVYAVLDGAFVETVFIRQDKFGALKVGLKSGHALATYNEHQDTWWLHIPGRNPIEFRSPERLKRILIDNGMNFLKEVPLTGGSRGQKNKSQSPMEKEMIDFGKELLEWEEDVNGDLRAEIPFFSEHIKVRLYDRERGTDEEEDWEYRIEFGSRELEAGVPADEIETGVYRKNAVVDKKRFVEGRVQKAVEALYRNVH